MGLSIHYNGRFKPSASLKEMIEEVKDIAEINNWKYQIFNENFPEDGLGKDDYNKKIYGICFTPPECEPIWLSFLSNGRMSSLTNVEFWADNTIPERKEYLYMLASKTQYAGIDIHKSVIQLLKYLKEKYLLELNLIDEGKYWETGDEELLKEIFDRYTFYVDNLGTVLNSSQVNKGESIENFITRIAKQLKKKGKK